MKGLSTKSIFVKVVNIHVANRGLYKTILMILILIWSTGSISQVKFYTVVSEQNIFYDQTFQVQYVIEGSSQINDFILPDFKGFLRHDVFEIPITTSIDPQTNQLIDTYAKIVVLSPRKNGSFTIPGATAVINGKKMRSNSVKVLVRRNSVAAIAGDAMDEEEVELQTEIRQGETAEDLVKKNFFLKVELSKRKCYVGEPIRAVYKLYSRLNASSQVMKRPSFTGFSVLEMVDAYDSKPDIEKVNGVPYYVNTIRKVQLFPLQGGKHLLDVAEVESHIKFVKVNKTDVGSLYSDPSRIPFEHTVSIKSEPAELTVEPLPVSHQPDSFTGAIGKFTIRAEFPEKNLAKGDLAKIRLVVSGSGNIPLITLPPIVWPKGVDTAEPRVSEDVNKYVFPLYGTKTFEYDFIPDDTGSIVMAPIQFPFYDPYQHIYKIATTQAVTLTVGDEVKEEERVFIAPGVKSIIRKELYWFALIVLIILSWLGYQLLSWRKHKLKAERIRESTPVDVATAKDNLEPARIALSEGKMILFYESIQEALWNEAAQRFGVIPSKLNRHYVRAVMAQNTVPKESIDIYFKILDECEWALYAPSGNPGDPHEVFARTAELIRSLR